MGIAGGFQRKSERANSVWQILRFAVCASLLFSGSTFAQVTRTIGLAWNLNPPEEMVTGYRLYYGAQPGKYTNVINLPVVQQASVPGLPIGTTYYFALTARNHAGIESEFSAELRLEVPSLSAPPIIYSSGNQVMEQDGSLTFWIGIRDTETAPADLKVSVVSDNPEVLPLSNILIDGDSYVRSVTITPRVGYVGLLQLQFGVTDGDGMEATTSLTVLVAPPNQPPTADAVNTIIVAEDSGLEAVLLNGVSPGVGENQPLRISAFSANTELIPDPFVLYTNPDRAAYLFFQSRPNMYGTCEIIVLLDDGQPLNNTAIQTFSVRILPRNDPPAITVTPVISTAEDTPALVPLFIQDMESTPDQLQVTVSSSNPSLIGPNGIQEVPSGSTRALALRPASNQFGKSSITVTATDPDGGSSSASFDFEVLPVNDPPTLSALGDISTMMNSLPMPVVLFGISAGAPNESQALNITATSSNPSVVPNPLVSYVQGAPSGLLTITPVLYAVGSATITVRVSEAPTGLSTVRTFQVTLVDFPALLPSAPDELTVTSEMAEAIPFVAYGGDIEPEALVVRATSLDPELIPPQQIQIAGNGARRNLSIVPANGRIGTGLVALTVECPSASVTKYIRVSVAKVISVAACRDAVIRP